MSTCRCDERGAVLVTFALLIVVIFTFVAFAIDLGFGRSDRRTSRSLADLASVAAGYEMAGHSDPDQFNPSADPVAACESAIQSVRTNTDDFDPPATASDQCATNFSGSCDGTPMTPVVVTEEPWTLTIEYPVTDASISDPNIGGTVAEDGEPCERMRVSLDHSRDTFFARLIGVDAIQSGGTAVVVGNIPDPNSRVVPAFLMLDRTGCKSIWSNVGQGTEDPVDPTLLYGDGILVRNAPDGEGGLQPGFIHTDSDASECNPSVANDYAIYATEPSGGDTMVVQSGVSAAGDTLQGKIESTATNGRSGAGGINVPASVGDIVGRGAVDEIYQSAITSLHSIAHPVVTSSGAPAGSTEFGCDGLPTDPATAPATVPVAYVNCNNFSAEVLSSAGLLLSSAETVVFSNNVSVSNGSALELLTTTSVTVRGQLSVAGRLFLRDLENLYVGNRFTIGNNGNVGLNAAYTDATSDFSCTNGFGPSPTRTTRVVIFNAVGDTSPALDSSGSLAMCQSTVYLAGDRDRSGYDEKSVTDGEACESIDCPLVSGNDIPGARFQMTGTVEWYGPNQSSTPLTPNIPLPSSGGLESLALWAEGGGSTNQTEASSISGGGTNFSYSGVFFNPNAKMYFAAGNAETGPKDAQFIGRSLQINGGRFEMKPTRQNAVPVPVRGTFQLIR